MHMKTVDYLEVRLSGIGFQAQDVHLYPLTNQRLSRPARSWIAFNIGIQHDGGSLSDQTGTHV